MLKRITISVPEEIAEKALKATHAGHAESVSAYFAQLAVREPDWADAKQIIDDLIDEAGGRTDADRAWAHSMLESDPDIDAA